jgi:hypothetical protein
MMKMFEGQSVVEHYIETLATSKTITQNEIDIWVRRDTTVELVQYQGNGKYQFRLKSEIIGGPPICQYVTVDCDGVMKFRKDHPWFVPGDLLFESFSEALEYVMAAKIVAKEAE